MDKYHVKILKRVANKLLDDLENFICSLEIMPRRFPVRKSGAYAQMNYRQIFVKNYTIIYHIIEETKEVLIITVRYSKSNF